MVRRRVSPEINALSTLMFVAVLLLLVVINLRQARQDASAGSGRPCGPDPLPFLSQGPNALVIDFFKPERRTRKKLKKTLALILSLAMAASLLSGCVSSREENTLTSDTSGNGTGDTSGEVQQTSGGEVNVYNWGEYIDESVLEDFEEATGIKVNYQMYDSNETMYGKIAPGGTDYDVVIPSDYMIARMIEEDMLEPLNFDNIPNFADIDPELKNPEYDPENLYSVPYMWGLMGVIYNTTMVDRGGHRQLGPALE